MDEYIPLWNTSLEFLFFYPANCTHIMLTVRLSYWPKILPLIPLKMNRWREIYADLVSEK